MAESSYEADVVVIGGGIAGIAAAMELLDGGRSVLLLERTARERFGGLARESFGGVFAVNTPEQKRAGIRDSEELALSDWLAYGELDDEQTWPRRWAEAFVSRCTEDVYRWLRRRGVSFLPVPNWTERGLFLPGNSVPRFHVVWGTGLGLIQALERELLDHPRKEALQVCFGHNVTELVTTDGQFCGCAGVLEDSGEEFSARGEAVIVAAGGIAGDLDQIREHWDPDMGDAPQLLLNGSHPPADGRMHQLVQQHGGVVTHLEKMWNYAAGVRHWKPRHPQHGVSLVPPKSALWVNYRGRRMGPPPLVSSFDTRYLVETICRQKKQYSWQILNWKIARRELAASGAEFNRAIRDRKRLAFYWNILFGNSALAQEFIDSCEDFVTAQSVDELVKKMNALAGTEDVDAALLAEQIRRYDDNIARGTALQNDDQLRRIAHARQFVADRLRTCKLAPIDDPGARPLIAIREQIVTRKSLGGVQTDLQSRVLDAAGTALPGLYAVGETAGFGGGGVHGRRALEGTFLASCVFSGRMAWRPGTSAENNKHETQDSMKRTGAWLVVRALEQIGVRHTFGIPGVHNTVYRLERWETPEGEAIVGKLPDGVAWL